MAVEQLIYTDAPRGKGVDPALKGYQIRACSAGVGKELQAALASYCSHYYTVPYDGAPRTAKDAETKWRTTAVQVTAIPDEVLREFPVSVSYDLLEDGRRALSITRYAGFTHDKRTGNAIVHLVVFAPDELARYASNPLAAARANLTLTPDPGEGNALPTLARLEAAAPAAPKVAPGEPALDATALASLIAAIGGARNNGRPVLICLADWHHGAPLIEWLLGLLPPSARIDTTFSTYESDRAWLPRSAGGTRPAGKAAAHDVLAICRTDERPFDLRPDEAKTFAVFNLADQRLSDVAPTAYANLAAYAATKGRLDRLQAFHELVERFGLGRDPGGWETLVPAAVFVSGAKNPTLPVDALGALVSVARSPELASFALGVLWPSLEAIVQARSIDVVQAASKLVAQLVDREPDTAAAPKWKSLAHHAAQALGAGQARLALALLASAGRHRDVLVPGLLTHWLADQQSAATRRGASADEKAALCELLAYGARLAMAKGDAPSIASLVLPLLEMADAANRTAALWPELGQKLVEAELQGLADPKKLELVGSLLYLVHRGNSPHGYHWLLLKLIENPVSEGQKLEQAFIQAAEALREHPDAGALARLVQLTATKARGRDERQAELLGLLANATLSSEVGKPFFDEYVLVQGRCRAASAGKPGAEQATRRWLVERGATALVARECIAAILQPNGEESAVADPSDAVRAAMKDWLGVVKPRAVPALRRELAGRLAARDGAGPRALALARALLAAENGALDNDEAVLLVGAATASLPFEPLDVDWLGVLRACPPPKQAQERGRFAALQTLTAIATRAASERDGSLRSLSECAKELGATWEMLSGLPSEDLARVLRFGVQELGRAGVSTPREADLLIDLAQSLRLPSLTAVPELVLELIADRDPVTRVLTMTAFAVSAMQKRSANTNKVQLAVIEALLENGDRQLKSLFQAHLHKRFDGGQPNYREHIAGLCQALGLEAPARLEPPAPPSRKPAADEPAGSDKEPEAVPSFFRKLFGGRSKDAESKGS
jgi:hypothetical protein